MDPSGGAPGEPIESGGAISIVPESEVVSELEPDDATAACEQVATARQALEVPRREAACFMHAYVNTGGFEREDPIPYCQELYEACMAEPDEAPSLDCTTAAQQMADCDETVGDINTCLAESEVALNELVAALSCENYTPIALSTVEVGQTPEICRALAPYCSPWTG
jgi:hypothetical protein